MTLRRKLHDELFVGTWPDGRLRTANIVLIFVIVAAVGLAILATEAGFRERWSGGILVAEALFAAIFLIEYIARVYAAAECEGEGGAWAKRWRFIRSPLGLIDLFVVVISFAPLVVSDATILRLVRLLRVFSLAKFGHFARATRELLGSIRDRSYDLLVCVALGFALLLAGASAMYWIEGDVQPEAFGSIPRALWWAVITLTTVGYGDVSPVTALGKTVGAFMAISSVLLVAMPTGIIAAAFSDAMQRRRKGIARELVLERQAKKRGELSADK